MMQIDDIIHNSSYRQSDSAFLTEFGGGFKKMQNRIDDMMSCV